MGPNLTRQVANELASAVSQGPLDSRQLHDVAQKMFRAAGCRVFSEHQGAGDTPVRVADLVVWHESLDSERGAPIVVEVLARTHALGALIPRLRRTKQLTGVRTLLALTTGTHQPYAEQDEGGGWLVQATLRDVLELLVDRDLNDALVALTVERSFLPR